MLKRILYILILSIIIAFPIPNLSKISDTISYYWQKQTDLLIMEGNKNIVVKTAQAAQISKVFCSSGQLVEKGEILVELDKTELLLKKELLLSRQRNIATEIMDAGTNKQSILKLQAKQKDLHIQYQIIEHQLYKCDITSPIKGKLIRNFANEGQHVASGQELFVIKKSEESKEETLAKY